MEQYNLPDELRGNWIWPEADGELPETYGFFCKDFTLGELPSSAELWISARSFFHAFINGEHLSYSLDLCPVRGSYAWSFDISDRLNTGRNKIFIIAHNTALARTSCLKQPNGLWCQLNISSRPFLWTDDSWMVQTGKCFAGNRPRRSQAGAFTEKINLGELQHNWQSPRTDISGKGWRHPAYSAPLDKEKWELIPFPAPPMTVSLARFESIVNYGTCHPRYGYTNISFETMRQTKGDGVYGAETYLYCREAIDTEAVLFVDNPAKMFVNGEPIYEAGVHQLQPGETYETGTAYCFRQKGEARTSVPLRLKEGWNRFDFFEKIVPGTFGMAMVLTGFGAGSLKLVREPNREAMPGWCIAGPLRTPLPNILGHLVLNQFDILEFYIPVKERPLDEAAMLSAYRFDPEKGSSADLTQNQDITLKQDDYAVLRLPHCHYGCPSFKISGTKGDVVYVVSSTEFDTGFVPPCFSDQKNVDTLILGKGESQWMACLPRGLQYIMIVARQVEDSVSIKESAAIVRKYSFENMGHFESSDKAMNEMWETGRRTLSTTVQEIFIDSPSRDEAQYVGDALIQSWAAYHVYGDFGLAQKSLKEFAHCQFETGEMPAACPSSYYINIPDYALLWPLWLHQHYMYTGSRQIIETLMPNLQRLLNYFESVATGSAGLLDGLDRFGGYCFLDHGDIDREGISTGLNALYSRALLSSAFIMEETGKPKEAKTLRDRAGRICNALRELCWDADKGLFADSFHDGKMSESFSLQTNILAIYGGVALSGNYSSIFRKLFSDQPPYYRDMPANTNTPYFNYFILETAFALGRRQWACEFMRWYWNSMLEDGARTWWELYDPRADKNDLFVGSKCHGYGVSPNGFLVREIAGVRPAKPGFTSIYFNPLTENLSAVKATIPTPYGHIMVDWKYTKDGQLEALIDANYPLSVIPELEPKVAKSAFIRVSDEVTVFASA